MVFLESRCSCSSVFPFIPVIHTSRGPTGSKPPGRRKTNQQAGFFRDLEAGMPLSARLRLHEPLVCSLGDHKVRKAPAGNELLQQHPGSSDRRAGLLVAMAARYGRWDLTLTASTLSWSDCQSLRTEVMMQDIEIRVPLEDQIATLSAYCWACN